LGLGLLIVEVPRPHTQHTHTHTRWNSSERGIITSQWLLLTQHTTYTRDEQPCPQQDLNPRSQKWSGSRLSVVPAVQSVHCALCSRGSSRAEH